MSDCNAGGMGYDIRLNSGVFMFFSGHGSDNINSSTALPLNNWTHVGVTIEDTSASLYINGVLNSTGTLYDANSANLVP